MKKMVNGVAVDMTAEEVAERQTEEAAWASGAHKRMRSRFGEAVQVHLDAAARKEGYDNIFTACTYAEENAVPKYQEEGRAFRAWRSLVWAHCAEVLSAVQAGERAAPSVAELIEGLPKL